MTFIHLILLVRTSKKKSAARKAVISAAKIMCKENKKRLTNNLDNVIKFLPSDREFFVKDSRIIPN